MRTGGARTGDPTSRTGDLATGRLVAYAGGSLSIGAFSTLPGLVLAYYLTDALDVAPGIALWAVLLPKIVTVLLYPVVGALSDLESHRTGRRVRLMWTGALLQPPAFVATFAVPESVSGLPAAAWVTGFFLVSAVAFTLFQVPYVSLPAELTRDPRRRITLLGTQVAVLAVAILAVGGGGPAIRDLAGGGHRGYLVMAAAVAALMFAGMVWALVGSARHPLLAAGGHIASPAEQYRDGLAALRTTREFRRIVTAFGLQSLGTAIMLAGAQYVATYVLGDEAALTTLFVALVAPAVVVMPLWTGLAHRRGKTAAYRTATALFAVAALVMVTVRWTPGWVLYVAVALAGVAYAGMQAMPSAMLPDAIDLDAESGGRRRSGAMSGLWAGAEATALTFGPVVLLVVLALTGFHSSTVGEVMAQLDGALWGIVVAFSLVPAVIVGASLLPLRGLSSAHRAW